MYICNHSNFTVIATKKSVVIFLGFLKMIKLLVILFIIEKCNESILRKLHYKQRERQMVGQTSEQSCIHKALQQSQRSNKIVKLQGFCKEFAKVLRSKIGLHQSMFLYQGLCLIFLTSLVKFFYIRLCSFYHSLY